MFYIQDENDKIVLFDEDKQKLQDTVAFMQQYQSLEIKEVQEGYVIYDFELMSVKEAESRKAQKERERLDALYMTRSDFFDGMILAFGLDSKELRAVIENILNSLNITDIEVKVALNNYDNALNFYRKHTLFTLLSGIEIPISEEVKIVITSEQWDKFFETKDYHELLPVEEVSDIVEDTVGND